MWLSLAFHRELADWKALDIQVVSRPTHLAEIICHEPTHIGFCDTSGIAVGVVWLDPARMGHNLIWWHTWPVDVISELVFSTNPHGTITNSDL